MQICAYPDDSLTVSPVEEDSHRDDDLRLAAVVASGSAVLTIVGFALLAFISRRRNKKNDTVWLATADELDNDNVLEKGVSFSTYLLHHVSPRSPGILFGIDQESHKASGSKF